MSKSSWTEIETTDIEGIGKVALYKVVEVKRDGLTPTGMPNSIYYLWRLEPDAVLLVAAEALKGIKTSSADIAKAKSLYHLALSKLYELVSENSIG